MTPRTVDAIRASASHAAFGSAIVQNNLCALVVEAIIDAARKPSWHWCSVDRAGWDFEHETGTKLEVKQSAARQTWAASKLRRMPRFDIRGRTGYWENGITWIAQPGRYAQLYIFAYHPIVDEMADHCDPLQWQFYVVRAPLLLTAQAISLSSVKGLAFAQSWTDLFGAVERERLK